MQAQTKTTTDPSDTDRMLAAIEALKKLTEEYTVTIAALIDEKEALHDKIGEQADEIEEQELQLKKSNEEIGDLMHEMAILEGRLDGQDDNISELARARAELFKGDVGAGRERLERVLSDMDSCWRLRV